MARVWLALLYTLATVANLLGFVLLLGEIDPVVKQVGLVGLFGVQALIAFLVGYPLMFGWTPHPRVNPVRALLAVLMIVIIGVLIIGICLSLGLLGIGNGVVVAIGVLLTLLVVVWIAAIILTVR